jgi:hypothetical protein
VNSPSVGELLQDASRQVRSILWEVTALDGPALGAAWPAFAARDALAAVPLNDPATRLLIDRAAGPRPRPNQWGRLLMQNRTPTSSGQARRWQLWLIF